MWASALQNYCAVTEQTDQTDLYRAKGAVGLSCHKS
jgi:hypothetical protein